MTYRFALLGCGQIGPRHAVQMARLGELIAVCDVDRQKADVLALQYGCIAVYSLDALLKLTEKFDLVSICTPNYLHAPHSIACLKAGVHVICEKPMTISTADALLVLAAVKSSGKKFFVVKQNRYNPPVAMLKGLLDRNALGHVHSFQVNCFWNRTAGYYGSGWKGKKDLDGGILFTQFSHFIDLLIWFIGEPENAGTIKRNFLLGDKIEFEDTGASLIIMKSGAIGTIQFTITAFAKNMEGSITIFGEKGTVKIGGEYLNTLEHFEVKNEEKPAMPSGRGENDYGSYKGSMSNHDKVYENVIMALDNREHQLVEGEEAARTIKMIELLYRPEQF
ncbi:MAG: Gfo/Idh/MocA family oxidoreductase [Chitinophagaceae bacterium]